MEVREIIEKELVVEKEVENKALIELEAEELLKSYLDGEVGEQQIYDFDEKYDANLTSLMYILKD